MTNTKHAVTDQLQVCCSIMCCNSSSIDQKMWKWQLFSANFLITPVHVYDKVIYILGAEVQNIPNKGPKRNEGDVKF